MYLPPTDHVQIPRLDGVLPKVTYTPARSADVDGVPQPCGGAQRAPGGGVPPDRVGHAVELGAMQGMVRRIGIRASVVHTWQGADIIVPNSQLVTEQVTNWTLTDQRRRIDLPVGVNYGAVPQHVIALLETVARDHPQVLPEPPPQAFFMGYGDSALHCTLCAWPDPLHHWPQGKSELTAAVSEAVSAAGRRFHAPACGAPAARDCSATAEEPRPPAAGGRSPRGKEAM